MAADNWTVTTVIGIVAAVASYCIGYYRANAVNTKEREKEQVARAREMALYVLKTECIRCAEQRAETQSRVDARIEEGSKMFAALQTGQALLIQRVEALTKQIEQLAR